MDALAGLLDGPRAHGAFLLRTSWTGPWALHVIAESPLTVLTAPKGEFWVMHDDDDPLCVGPGDLAITRGPDHYVTADHPDTEPTIEIHPGQECRSLTGEPLVETMSLGLRSWGNHHDGDTVMMVGAYHSFGEIGERSVACHRFLHHSDHCLSCRWGHHQRARLRPGLFIARDLPNSGSFRESRR